MKIKRVLLFILAGGFAAISVLLALPDEKAKAYSEKLSAALDGARSVTFVEYSHGEFEPETVPELVFSRVTASPRQIEAFRSATGPWLTPMTGGRHMCFEPHHRVEIVRPDGKMVRFLVCFQCNGFVFDDEHRDFALPAIWRLRLSRLFTSVGMPPRSRAEYSALEKKHPDYHLVQDARRVLEKEFLESEKDSNKSK